MSRPSPVVQKSIPSFPRFDVLDAIRGIGACFVLLSHFGSPPVLELIRGDTAFLYPVKALYGNLFPGPPAVVVFFVLSGFCIHFPYRGSAPLAVAPFLARRCLRIGIPMLIAIGFSIPMQVNLSVFRSSVLWSLVSELIYYTLYPWIRRAAMRYGWGALIGLSFVGAAVALAQFPSSPDFTPFGNTWNWMLCLPSWLIGCLLADQLPKGSAPPPTPWKWLLFWRLTVWSWAIVASALRFHSPVGYPWTLFLFGVPIFFWLRAELGTRPTSVLDRFLRWTGQWSYSLYLVHMLGIALMFRLPFGSFHPLLRWSVGFALILSLAFLFYLVVELPSHRLSRRAGEWADRRFKAERGQV